VRGFAARAGSWLVAVGVGGYAFLPLCDLLFDCGCGFPWLGTGHAHCDIHVGGPPDCPWCDHGWAGYAAMGFSALAGLLAMILLPRGLHWSLVGLGAVAAVLLGIVAAGLVTAWWLDLPVLTGI
jgi:hypothetical protein